jgi:hypothetical protein
MQKKKEKRNEEAKRKGSEDSQVSIASLFLDRKKNLRVSGNRFTMMVEYSSSAEAPGWT